VPSFAEDFIRIKFSTRAGTITCSIQLRASSWPAVTALGRTRREYAAVLAVLLFLFWDIWPAHDRSFGKSAGLPGPCMTELLRISVRLRVFAAHLLFNCVEIAILKD
jgi:hypothetical protein